MTYSGRFSFYFLVILGLAILAWGGIGSASAQQIFIKKGETAQKAAGTQAEDKESAPTIFLKPEPGAAAKKLSSAPYRERGRLKELQKRATDQLKTLADWRAAGLKPENGAELLAYAQANRAVSQNVMYERRKALIAQQEKDKRARQAARAREAAKAERAQAKVSADGPVIVKPYQRESVLDAAKPRRVFNPY